MTEQAELQFSNSQTAVPEDLTLAGPVFETEPGWGGKLSVWFKKSFSFVLPILAILILGVGLTFYFIKTGNSLPSSQDKKIQPAVNSEIFRQTAKKGHGVTHLARQATAEYLATSPQNWITPEHKIFIEDYLKDKIGTKSLEIGEIVEFSLADIQGGIERAKKLKPEELENLTKYIKRVSDLK